MTTFNVWFNFLGAAVLLASKALGSPVLQYKVSPAQLEPGQTVTLEIRLDRTQLPAANSKPVLKDNLLVENESIKSLDQQFQENEKEYVWQYQLTAYEVGMKTIPPIEVEVGPMTFSTESKRIEIISTRQPGDNGLRPSFDSVSIPFEWIKYALLALFSLVLVGLSYFLYMKYLKGLLRKKEPLPTPLSPVYTISDEEWLKNQLHQLKVELQQGDDGEAAIDKFPLIIREYYSRKYHFPVRAWTTREFSHKMPALSQINEVSSILQTCDELRFKKMSIPLQDRILEQVTKSEQVLCI